jgi:predicted nucleic acid-binding protein
VILCDTNLLLHCAQPDHSRFDEAVGAVKKLLTRGEQLVVFLQNLVEFWNVATRPRDKNGLGYPTTRTDREIDRILESVALLPDHARTAEIWRSLVIGHQVQGVQVHDARLVAGMKAYGIGQVLTYNPKDFARYSEITVFQPSAIAA